ncbi:MFS transporter, partial [Streptomyces albidoflavus]
MGSMRHEESPTLNPAPTPGPGPSSGPGPALGPNSGPGTGGTAAPGPSPWVLRLVALGLVLAALNLRPAITSLGPLIKEVRDGLHMSGSVAGLLTSVPPLC